MIASRGQRIAACALWLAPLSFLGVLLFFPLGNILAASLGATGAPSQLDGGVLDAIWFTLWQAALSTLLCLVLGVPLAYLLYRTNFRGQELLKSLITLPFVLPSIVVAIAFTGFRKWHEIYSELGMFDFAGWDHYWIVAAHVFLNLSLVVRGVGSSWQSMDSELDDAAALDGAGRFRTVWDVWLPQLRGALVGSGSLVFLFCLASYGVILVLGRGVVDSIETEIATAALREIDLRFASTLALIQLGLSAVALGVAEGSSRQRLALENIDGPTARRRLLDRRDRPLTIFAAILVGFLILIPLLNVLAQGFVSERGLGLDNFFGLAGRGERDILNISILEASLNSIRNALVATVIATPLALLTSQLIAGARGTRGRARGAVGRARFGLSERFRISAGAVLSALPLAVSPIVLGLGYLLSFGDEPLALRQSWLIVPLAQALIVFPLMVRLLTPALLSIDANIAEAAALDGAGTWKSFRGVSLPLVSPVLRVAIGYALVISLGEFGAASLLAYGGQETLPLVLFRLISRPGAENYGLAMATAALILLLSFAMLRISAWRSGERTPRRRVGQSVRA